MDIKAISAGRAALALAMIGGAAPSHAQLITLNLLNDLVIDLGAQVTVNTGDIAVNTSAIASLNLLVNNNTTAINMVDNRVTTVDNRVTTVDNRVTAVDNRVTAIDARVDSHDTAITNLQGQGGANAAATAALAVQVGSNSSAIGTINARLDVDAAALVSLDSRVTATETGLAALVAGGSGGVGLVAVGPGGGITIGAGAGGNTVSFAGTAGDRRLTGVADGVAANDAATMGQLAAASQQTLASAQSYTDQVAAVTLNQANAYTDMAIAESRKAIRRDLNAMAASTAAIAGLPQSIVPGEGMVGAGIGGRGDSFAVALGLSKAFRSPHTPVVKAGASLDTRRGEVTYNAAVGFHF